MKNLFAFTILLASTIWCQAQDIILLTNGDTLHCKIIEAGASDIKYQIDGVEKVIRSKNYITHALNFTERKQTAQSSGVNKQLTQQIEKEKDLSAGDHLIKSGRSNILAVVFVTLGASIALGLNAADTDQNITTSIAVSGMVTGVLFQALSVHHKIKAGKKLNKLDTTVPK